jgi:hypothetical protein
MFLAVFIPALMGALATMMASLIGRAILALGIGFVTYTGTMVVLTSMESALMSSVGALPADLIGLLGYLWIDKAITVIFSSVAASVAIRGIGGTVKRAVLK